MSEGNRNREVSVNVALQTRAIRLLITVTNLIIGSDHAPRDFFCRLLFVTVARLRRGTKSVGDAFTSAVRDVLPIIDASLELTLTFT